MQTPSQTPSRQRVAAVPAVDTFPTLVRVVIALVATATLLCLFAPTMLPAQDSAGMHRVEAGESLWALAARYYGDGTRWTELAALNKLDGAPGKGLVVGDVIRVPATAVAPSARVAAAPPANTPRVALARALQPAKPLAAGGLASQTADRGDAPPVAAGAKPARTPATAAASPRRTTPRASARAMDTSFAPVNGPGDAQERAAANAQIVARASSRIWNVDLQSQRVARGRDAATVFLPPALDAPMAPSSAREGSAGAPSGPTAAEYASAPFPIEAAALQASAVLGRRTESGGSFRDVQRFMLADEVEIGLTAGALPAIGTRFVSVDTGAMLRPGVRMALPTGVFEVTRAAVGQPIVARVIRQSGRIEEGQRLLPFASAPLAPATNVAVARDAGAPSTEVTWVEGGALLPSLHSFLLLAAGDRDGLKPGDTFALVKRMGLGPDAPEQRVALVRVVRVTPFGSTAVVVHQDQPLIAVGGAARLVGRAE